MKNPTLLKIRCVQHERSGYGKEDIVVKSYLETIVYYNANGKAIKEEHFLPNGELETILENEYNDQGLVTVAKQFDNEGELLQQTDFVYDEYQNVIRQNHYFGDESTKFSDVYVYENGSLIREDIFEGDKFINVEKEYQYDDRANLIRIVEYDEDGNKKSVTENEYNESNFVTRRVKDEIMEKDRRVYLFEYDEDGNKIKDLIYDYEDILISKTYYTYNDKKQLLEKEEEDLDRYLKTTNHFVEDKIKRSETADKEGNIMTWTEFDYDEDDLVISQKYYARDETDNEDYRLLVEYQFERE